MSTRRIAVVLMAALTSHAACTAREGTGREPGVANDSTAAIQPGTSVSSAGADTAAVPSMLSPEALALIPAPPATPPELAALAPAHLQLKDMGFRIPTAAPDTAGLKSRGKIQREWAEALIAYSRSEFDSASTHLERAREHLVSAVNADSNWPNRLRNLEAATLYASGPAGAVKAQFGEIANPNPDEILDVGFEWVLLHEDLRLGRGKEAVARLRVVQRSQLSVGLEARKLMTRLLPNEPPPTDPPKAP